MKIAHIVGNRPQFIKLALLQRALEKKEASTGLIIHTGQHYENNMSGVFFQELRIPNPDYQLAIHNLPHNVLIGKMLMELDGILERENPDCVVVYGDTNTTLAGALAARKRNILLAHVEAGIRTGHDEMPEESNRYLTDRMSDLNFTCTTLGLDNLRKEGFGGNTISSGIYNTGDLMYDAALLYSRDVPTPGRPSLLGDRKIGDQPFALATIHRAENTDDKDALGNIVSALNAVHRTMPVLFPAHPRTRRLLEEYQLPVDFHLVSPLGYFDLLGLLNASRMVITDSGGLSREAFFFCKPTLVVMKNPFWPEIFLHGNCLQAPALTDPIIEQTTLLLKSDKPFEAGIFGDGRAAQKISEILLTAI